MKKITILIPAYNEEDALPLLYENVSKIMNEMTDYEFELLFVNDGSRDNTINEIKKLREQDNRVCYVDFARNFGKEIAMLAGFDYMTGDCVVILDADLQDPPELIPEMVKYWEEGYDDVYARRKARAGETWLKKFTSKEYYRTVQKFTKVPIQIDTGDFRLLDRRCVNVLKKMREDGRCSKSLFSWIGYKKKEILYDRPARVAGKTKYNYSKMINLAIDGITAFTMEPLRWSIYLSIPTALAWLIYLICAIVKACHVHAWMPYQTIILLILFFATTQMLLMGIMGEYIGRVFIESKSRPLYLVNEYNGEKEMNK